MKEISVDRLSIQYNENMPLFQQKEDRSSIDENNFCIEYRFLSHKLETHSFRNSFINHSDIPSPEKRRGILVTKDVINDYGQTQIQLFGNNDSLPKPSQLEKINNRHNDEYADTKIDKLEKILQQKIKNKENLEREIKIKRKELKNIEAYRDKANKKCSKYIEIDENLSLSMQNLKIESNDKNILIKDSANTLKELQTQLEKKEEESKSLFLKIELANIRIKEAIWMKEEKETELFLLKKLTPEFDRELHNLNRMEAFNTEQINELRDTESGLKEMVSNLEDDIKDQRNIVSILTSTINELNFKANKQLETLHKQKEKKAKFKAEIEEIEKNVEKSNEIYAKNESEVKKLREKMLETISCLEDISQEISAFYIILGENSPSSRMTMTSHGRKSIWF
ncbi:unnamed protein product [Blepharisma stoltei]|uniref:Uncharacterized protein n=1 Tax=Blepharisma stoltei TaxID=1481888 RepID=A0AAU9I910_9CILI|nr:unnamed protein product [Blepharisma stoltei]